MPGFMDMMRQKFGGGRLPIQPPPGMAQLGVQSGAPPVMQPGGIDQFGFPPMDSGIVRPGQFGGVGGGMDEMPMSPPQIGGMNSDMGAVKRPMLGPDQMGPRNPRRPMPNRGARKLGQGGEPVF